MAKDLTRPVSGTVMSDEPVSIVDGSPSRIVFGDNDPAGQRTNATRLRLHNKLVGVRHNTGRSADVASTMDGGGDLRINDLIFYIPPTAIKITGREFNHKWHPLRTTSSIKVRSGHGILAFQISLPFTRDSLRGLSLQQVLNRSLLPLIKEFRRTPFCELENELLRRSLPVEPGGKIAAALESISVRALPGAPGALAVELSFLWFNHKPFTPHFLYRKEWTNELTDAEKALYQNVGDIEYRRLRGSPARVYNSTARKPADKIIRSAAAMVQLRQDLLKVNGRIEDDDIEIRQEILQTNVEFDSDTSISFWEVRVPSSPPPRILASLTEAGKAVPLVDERGSDGQERHIVEWDWPRHGGGRQSWRSSAGTRDAFLKLADAASKEGITLQIASAWRSDETQRKLWADQVSDTKRRHPDWTEIEVEQHSRKYTAPPKGIKLADGSVGRGSQHNDATALDIIWVGAPSTYDPVQKRHRVIWNGNNDNLYATSEWKWIEDNAPAYGFKRLATEAWHFNYGGEEVSTPSADPALVASEFQYQGIPDDLSRKIEVQADKHGIPRPLAFALVHRESGQILGDGRLVKLDPRAVSGAGARGLTQVMPSTALGERPDWSHRDLDNLYDPEVSLDVGLGYLAKLGRKFGNWRHALQAYNWGPGNMDRALAGHKSISKGAEGYADAIAEFARSFYQGDDIANQIRDAAPLGPRSAAVQIHTPPLSAISGVRSSAQDRNLSVQQLRNRREKILAELADRAITEGAVANQHDIMVARNFQERLAGLETFLTEQDIRDVYLSSASSTGPLTNNAGAFEEAQSLNQEIERLVQSSSRDLDDLWFQREKPDGEGWHLVEDKVTRRMIFKRRRKYDIPRDDESVVILDLGWSMENRLSSLPVNGWRYPTLQFLGGRNEDLSMTIAFKGEQGRRRLETLLQLMKLHVELAISHREHHKHLGIGIENDLLNAIGNREVILETWRVETTPSMKDVVLLHLSFMNSTTKTTDGFSVPQSHGFQDVANDLLKLVMERSGMSCRQKRGEVRVLQDPMPETYERLWDPFRFKHRNLRYEDFRIQAEMNRRESERENESHRRLREWHESLKGLDQLEARLGQRLDGRIFVKARAGLGPFEKLATDLLEILNEHGAFVEHYPEIYNLGAWFVRNQEKDDEPWPLSQRDKNPSIFNGERGELDKFVQDMDIYVKHELIPTLLWGVDEEDAEVRSILRRMDMIGRIEGQPCYPDLDLPPNPITGRVEDTNPDFYFYNASDVLHGGKDDPDSPSLHLRNLYKRRAKETLQASHRAFETEQVETDNSKTLSRNPKWHGDSPLRDSTNPLATTLVVQAPAARNVRLDPPRGDRDDVAARASIAADLNFDLYDEFSSKSSFPEAAYPMGHDFTIQGGEQILDRYMDNEWVEEKLTMRRAFPTFKVFFIEEDQQDRVWKVFDDFYGLNSIEEIRIVRSRKIAADTAIIRVTNISGTLSNRKFPEFSDSVKAVIGGDVTRALTELDDVARGRRATESLTDSNDRRENPFHSTMLKEGTKIQVRLGYSNDPEELETVFNGQIVSMEGDSVMTLVCQSYATELVAFQKGVDPNKKYGFASSDTDELLSDLIAEPEVKHFGRWRLEDVRLFPLRSDLRPDGRRSDLRWGFVNTPADDNIFPEEWNDIKVGLFHIVEYVLYHTTIWDVFKEMELRHPGWIASPVPYDDRMTMFFGVPCMEYFARGPRNMDEIRKQHLFRSEALQEVQRLLGQQGLLIERPDGGALLSMSGARGRAKIPNPVVGVQKFSKLEWMADTSAGSVAQWFDGMLLGRTPLVPINKGSLTEAPSAVGVGSIRSRKLASEISENIDSGVVGIGRAVLGDMVRSFRRYHLLTSENDIVQNDIRADHRDTFNTVSVHANDNPTGHSGWLKNLTHDNAITRWLTAENVAGELPVVGGAIKGLVGSTEENVDGVAQDPVGPIVTISVDDGIRKNYLRHEFIPEPNCSGKYLAMRYGVAHLMRSLKDTYKGTITVLGDPTIKPHDICYIQDAYVDMAGPIEVEQVVHTMSVETGFVTEIVPDLCVTARKGIAVGILDGMGQVWSRVHQSLVEQYGNEVGTALSALVGFEATFGAAAIGVGAASLSIPAALAASASGGLYAAGGLKFLSFLTNREPLVITPLIRSGKPFVSGFDGMERDGLVSCIKGLWRHWMEDSARGWNFLGLAYNVVSREVWKETR